MVDVKQTVTRTENDGVDANGASVQQKTKRIQTDSGVDGKTTTQNIVWYVAGLIEVLLIIRLVLKMLGANPSSGFVSLIYNVTGILTAPFDRIFSVSSTTNGQTQSVFEPSIVVAIIVYGLVAWGITKLFTLNEKD